MLQTVHYVDEEPVTYRSDRDRVLFETIKSVLGLTVREIHPMLEKILAEGLDPVIADGELFEFGNYDVPPPNAKINLLEAAEICGRHIKTCEMLLSGEVDRAEAAMRGEKPDFLRVTRGNADYGGPVGRDMERLQGRSRNDTVSDTVRGSGSPLGHGEGRRRK